MPNLKVWFIILMVLLLAACAGNQTPATIPTATTMPTATVMPTTAVPTATATPMPTATPISEPVSTSSPWWTDRVFYEIFVRSFYDSDGDGIGDFQGVIEKLDYLNDGDPATDTDLGIGGIWLMPINASPSYHGYDVVDYYAVNPDYGTMDDFQALLAAADARGIEVIIDLVVNHTSTEHPWFQAARQGDATYESWYRWADEAPDYTGPWGQEVWHLAEDRYYYGLFWGGMPDLNYNTPEVSEAMFDIARYWLTEVGVDGFRVDAIKYIVEDGQVLEDTDQTHAWLTDFYQVVETANPDALLVGEAWTISSKAAEYVGDEMDLVFEFDLAEAMLGALRGGDGRTLARVQTQVWQTYPRAQYATFLTNHDQNRVMSQIRENMGAAKLGAALLLTSPGVPFIYYGEEIGMVGTKPDERIRTPMQWTSDPTTAGFTTGDQVWEPLQDGLDIYNVAAQTDDPDSLLNQYRTFVHLRQANPALLDGDLFVLESDKRAVYAFIRHHADQTVLVLFNLTRRDVDEYVLSLAESPLQAVSAAETLFGDGEIALPSLEANGGINDYQPLPSLPPQSVWVVELKP